MRFGAFGDLARAPLTYVPRLNPLSPLARGVRYLWVPLLGVTAPDLVGGGRFAVAGTITTAIDRGQPAWYTAGATNGLDSPATVNLSPPMSMGVVFRPTTVIVFSEERLFGYSRASSLGTRNAIGLRSYFGSIDAFSVNNSGTLVKDSAPNAPTDKGPNAAVAVFRSASFRRAFLNGRAGPGNTTTNIPLARETLCVGSGAGTTRATGHAGYYYLAVVWDRELTEPEAIEWTRDPWQMLLPPPGVGLWVPGDVGGGALSGAVDPGSSATAASTVAGTQTHVGAVAAGSSATAGSTPAGTQIHVGAVAAGVTETTSSTPSGTSAYSGAVAPGSTATLASEPAGTQVHVGAVAAGSSATAGSESAGTQVHVGAVAAGVSATSGTTVAGGGNVYSGAIAPGSTATLASEPAGTQVHVGAVAAGSSATAGSEPTGAQVHVGAVAAGVSATSGTTVAGGGNVYSGAVAPGSTATLASEPAGTQVHVGAAAAGSSATAGSEPAGTQVHVGAVAAGVSATSGTTVAGGGDVYSGAVAPGSTATAGSEPAGTQIHVGGLLASVSATQASTPAGIYIGPGGITLKPSLRRVVPFPDLAREAVYPSRRRSVIAQPVN